jgi:hypothetical protein
MGRWFGLEAVPVVQPYPELAVLLRRAAPALVALPLGAELRLLVIARGGRRALRVLDPHGRLRPVPLATVRAALTARLEARWGPELTSLLQAAGIEPAGFGS